MRAKEFITPIKKEFQDPADDPNAGFDKEFKQDSIFNQSIAHSETLMYSCTCVQ